MEKREKVIHALVSSAAIILYVFFVSSILLASAVFTTSPIMAYILTAIVSLGLGCAMYYMMEKDTPAGHITEAGLFVPVPAVLCISVILFVIQKTVSGFREISAKLEPSGNAVGGSGLVQLFNSNMPNFIALSIIAYISFNIPLVYLLVKRGEKKEIVWYLLAPIILAVLLFGSHAAMNTLIGGGM